MLVCSDFFPFLLSQGIKIKGHFSLCMEADLDMIVFLGHNALPPETILTIAADLSRVRALPHNNGSRFLYVHVSDAVEGTDPTYHMQYYSNFDDWTGVHGRPPAIEDKCVRHSQLIPTGVDTPPQNPPRENPFSQQPYAIRVSFGPVNLSLGMIENVVLAFPGLQKQLSEKTEGFVYVHVIHPYGSIARYRIQEFPSEREWKKQGGEWNSLPHREI
jgi:hypothetical protein